MDENLSKLIKFSRVNYKQQCLKRLKNANFKHKINFLSKNIKITKNNSTNHHNHSNNHHHHYNSSCNDECFHQTHQNSQVIPNKTLNLKLLGGTGGPKRNDRQNNFKKKETDNNKNSTSQDNHDHIENPHTQDPNDLSDNGYETLESDEISLIEFDNPD